METLATYYDLIASITKNEEVTRQELELIQKNVKSGNILDIACGTGRHLIPLANLGYKISGLDSDQIHLQLLQKKSNSKLTLYESDFKKADISERFDALLLFWNSLNELCHDSDGLNEFFKKAIKLLKEKGIIIINFDDIDQIEPSSLNFTYEGEFQTLKFNYQFIVIDFDNENKISTSNELLTLKTEDRERLISGQLIQKWWTESEVTNIAKTYGFKVNKAHIKANNEIYLILKKP